MKTVLAALALVLAACAFSDNYAMRTAEFAAPDGVWKPSATGKDYSSVDGLLPNGLKAHCVIKSGEWSCQALNASPSQTPTNAPPHAATPPHTPAEASPAAEQGHPATPPPKAP